MSSDTKVMEKKKTKFIYLYNNNTRANTGWFTTSRVENEWTQLDSLSGEPEIL